MTKHGDIEHDSKKAKGYGSDALTESEARHLANDKPAQAVRDRIIEEGDAAVSRRNGQDAGSIKKPLPNPPLIREGSEESAPSYPSPDKGRLGGVSSSSQLPPGWIETTIGEINFYKSKNITPASYPGEVFDLYSVPIFPTSKPEIIRGIEIGSSKQEVNHGDVLLCKINPRINRVWSVGEKLERRQIASSEWIAIRNHLLSTDYLKYAFTRKEFRDLLCSEVAGVGGSLTRAQPKKVATYSLPLAPLPEQIRIANKLDSILAKVDNAQARLEKIPTLLKRFRQAVLAAATSGELTRENTDDFGHLVKVGELAEDIRYGTSKKCDYESGDVPVLRIPNMKNGIVDLTDLKYADFDKKELEKLKLKNNDILIIRSNGSLDLVGQAALISEKETHCLFAGYLIRIRFKTNLVSPKYVLLCFQSPKVRSVIELNARSTSGVNNINSQELSSLEIPLPNIEEQGEIVRRVESLFALADSVEKQYKAAKQRLDRLTQAVLAKAFRGELVPQDPDDEPAAELLKRIQAQRTQQHTGKKRHAAS